MKLLGWIIFYSTIFCLILNASAFAKTESIAAVKGQFTFNFSGKSCYALQGKALGKLKKEKYSCDLDEGLKSGSDVPYIKCSNGNSATDKLVFKTKSQCEDERKTQLANE